MKRFLKPLLIILAILLLTLSVSAGDLYSTYDKRIKITIDHTKIDADLSWFPVTVFLTSSQMEEVFTELTSDEDFDRIAFTSSDGETQLYADCELFDYSEQKAIYHVSKTGWTISSSADQDIYLYYDNTAGHNTTYISKSGGTAAQSVWDTNFKAVYHMNDAIGHIIDATSNQNDGQKGGGTNLFAGVNHRWWRRHGDATVFTTEHSDYHVQVAGTGDTDNDTIYYYPVFTCEKDTDYVLTVRLKANTWAGLTDKRVRLGLREGNNGGNISRPYFTLAEGDDIIVSVTGNSGDNTQITVSINVPDDFNDDESFDIEIYDMSLRKASDLPQEATGLVGKGQDFDGSNDYIVISHDNSIADLSNITIESIFYADSYPGTYPYLGAKSGLSGYWSIYRYNDGSKFEFRHEFDTSRGIWRTADISTETWTNYVVSFEVSSSNDPVIYYDGVSQSVDEVTTPSGTPTYSTGDIYIGHRGDSVRYFDGIVDETRISSTVRSAAWISATYSTLWDTLLTYGSEETAPTGEVSNVLFIFSNF